MEAVQFIYSTQQVYDVVIVDINNTEDQEG